MSAGVADVGVEIQQDAALKGIAVKDLVVEFRHDDGPAMKVVDRISFDVPPGQFLSIVGPSGCGKSTLLKILSGLVKPSSGTLLVGGLPVGVAGEKIGYMFQRDNLFPWATVTENIAMGAELTGMRPERIPARVKELLAFLRLDGFENHLPHRLSGGMRQRVALGRLLAYEPDIYLMDEPFGALDSQTKAAMGHELLRIWHANQRSVLFVTHDIEEAVTLSDRVIVLSSRPSRIALDRTIDLERPRDRSHLRKNPRFSELVDEIWSALEH
jgi:NitT/TauT family transport system ATP-binding protein